MMQQSWKYYTNNIEIKCNRNVAPLLLLMMVEMSKNGVWLTHIIMCFA